MICANIDVTARLFVNDLSVPHCQCDPTRITHWSYHDMEVILGRPVEPTDTITVRVESPGLTSFAQAR